VQSQNNLIKFSKQADTKTGYKSYRPVSRSIYKLSTVKTGL